MTALGSGPLPRAARRADRRTSRYRRLLVLYPKAFRDEFGDDLVQAHRDLVLASTDGRGSWWRITRDLLSSAARERAASLRPGGHPPVAALVGLAALVLVLVVIGSPGIVALPVLMFVVLPIFGVTRIARAWTTRRATAGRALRPLVTGVAALVTAGVAVALLGDDAGYWVFLALAATLITAAAAGTCWAGYRLVRPTGRRRGIRLRAALVLVPSVAVLGFVFGASVNSYRNSLGPPGDHSATNASSDTRDLWHAAYDGDLDEVRRLTTETCADPWVKLPIAGGRHNAKGMAETRGRQISDVAPFGEIADHLGDYQDDWYDRCGRTDR